MQGTVRTTNSEAKSDIGGIDLCGAKPVVIVWKTSSVGDTFLCEGKHTGLVDFKRRRITERCLIKMGLYKRYISILRVEDCPAVGKILIQEDCLVVVLPILLRNCDLSFQLASQLFLCSS